MREDVDPRIDKMIAFLYGELPPSEEKAFRRLLEKDAALRAELEELSQARGALAGWEVEEHVPSFVLVDSGAERPARSRARGIGFLERLSDSLRSFGAAPAWAFATAAVALVVLAAAGFRVERVAGGLAFRFGGDRAATSVPETLPGVGPGQPLELASRPAETGGGSVVPVSGTYLTREEFDSYNADLMNTLVGLLNRYDERRDQETVDLLQAFYGKINDRQVWDYERINRRIDALGADLLLETNRSRSLEELLQSATVPTDTNPARTAEEE